MTIPRSFYTRPNVLNIARELLGKLLVTKFDEKITSGIITETEAYEGITDRASHAYGGNRTHRTEIMFWEGGTAYIYLCYGVHSLFNIVTSESGIPDAVLIRGIRPVDGKPVMLDRTGKKEISGRFSDGPGKVSKALGIHYSMTGTDLTKKPAGKNSSGIWLEDTGLQPPVHEVLITTRIGVEYAGEDALRLNRFLWAPEQ